ncbi:hypothetical protein GMRT_12350 [Giardia muris]|uniref:Leucine-rich repeat protein n=1 Tax=Giardia muris TaxID=5742 RepID=A0A4Z1SNE8_GIAMU|nr:hypothetical protein GMRT_12350 [Giardia muris]|eukprot:TNJ27294.1 hypothetical protein GMRT_12350 [Giardia muris]
MSRGSTRSVSESPLVRGDVVGDVGELIEVVSLHSESREQSRCSGSRLSGHGSIKSRPSRLQSRGAQFDTGPGSESSFTVGLSIELEEMSSDDPVAFIDPSATLKELYGVSSKQTIMSMKDTIYDAEDGDTEAGIAAYRSACLSHDLHPSAIVIAAIRRNPIDVSLRMIRLGPVGAECFAATLSTPFKTKLQSLDLTGCGIGPSGLCSLTKGLTNIPQDWIRDPTFEPPEDLRAEHTHTLSRLDLTRNSLLDIEELLTTSSGLPPFTTNEQLVFANTEFERIKALEMAAEEKVREKLDLSGKITSDTGKDEAKNAKEEENVDPYAELIRATALYSFGSSAPRPFFPPKKLTEEDIKKMKAAGKDPMDIPPDPTFESQLEFHQKLANFNVTTSLQSSVIFGHLLRGLPYLVDLTLAHNELTDNFLVRTASVICTHPALTNLSLAGNRFTDQGLVALLSSMDKSCIVHLDMSGNNLGSTSACLLGYALSKHAGRGSLRLTSLDLSDNKIGDEAGAFLIGALTGGMGLPDIMAYGMTAVTSFVGTLPSPIPPLWRVSPIKPVDILESLTLARCDLQVTACLQLCRTLTKSAVIRRLDISSNFLGHGLGFYSITRALVQRKEALGSNGNITLFRITNRHVDMEAIRTTIPDAQPFEQIAEQLGEMVGNYLEVLEVLQY